MSVIIDIPLIVCVVSCLFYGAVFVWNKDLIWTTPQSQYPDYTSWFAANNPKGLWYAPLIAALLWPQAYHKVSFNPVSDFLWERLAVSVAALGLGIILGKWLYASTE